MAQRLKKVKFKISEQKRGNRKHEEIKERNTMEMNIFEQKGKVARIKKRVKRLNKKKERIRVK